MSGAINLDGVEAGGASASTAPWFDWKIDYPEFSQIYPGLVEQPEEPRAAAKADVPTLEADIAALVTATADNLRHSESAAPPPREVPQPVPHLRVVPPGHDEAFRSIARKMFRPRLTKLRPRAWLDIRPGDAVRMVTTGGGLRTRPKLRAMVALTLGLFIGWIAVLPLSVFRTYLARAVDEKPSLVQVPRSDSAAARPQATADVRGDTTNPRARRTKVRTTGGASPRTRRDRSRSGPRSSPRRASM